MLPALVDKQLDTIRQRLTLDGDVVQIKRHMLKAVLQDSLEKLGLGAEVVLYASHGNTGPRGNVLYRGVVKPQFIDARDGRFDNPAMGFGVALGLGFSLRPTHTAGSSSCRKLYYSNLMDIL